MKDSAKLLNFNVNRELKFSVFRQVDFDARRELSFNLNRGLSFKSQRDLGFGKRGVIFRGYVCPACRAPVAKDAPMCDECGVKFEQQSKPASKPKVPKTQKAMPSARKPNIPKAKPSPTKPAPQRRSTFECPVCSKILYVGVGICPGCSTRFTTDAPPPYQTPAAGASSQSRTTERQAPQPGIPTTRPCANCGFGIPPQDRFCPRCGTPKQAQPDRTTVSWDEYMGTGRDDGIVSWDEYSGREKGG